MPSGSHTTPDPPSSRTSSFSSISVEKESQQHGSQHRTAPMEGIEADALDELNLPYRSLTEEANMRAYTTETPSGNILREVQSNKTGRTERYELVTFTVGDPENPKNWSKAFKWWCTMVVAFTCFTVAFNSAVITANMEGPAEEFGVSEEVSLLAITMFVIGFGVGPMAFAPMSEILGRRIIYGTTLFVAVVFIIPCAVSKNAATLVVCRLIDGIAFSAPMTLGKFCAPWLLSSRNSLTRTYSWWNPCRSMESRGARCPDGRLQCSSLHRSCHRSS